MSLLLVFMSLTRFRIVLAVIAGSTAGILIDVHAARSQIVEPRLCDIYASGHTPCVAAHSTVRSLYARYAGPLYQVKWASDNAVRNIGLLPDGYADAATQDEFCADAPCVITRIYDQSPRHNDLAIAAGGHPVYGVSISPGMGYRDNRTSGVAIKGKPEGMVMVSSGTHYNSGCCFDHGDAETSGTDTGAGHMDTVNVSRDLSWPGCHAGPGPGVHADLENGIFHWSQRSCNPAASIGGGPRPFISAWLKNDGRTRFALKWGDARSGGLHAIYAGALPAGYAPMRQEGAIVLGVGGDNSHASAGSFFEGLMTAGYPTDAADKAVQANIVAARDGAPTGLTGTLAPGSEIALRATTACCTQDYIRNRGGLASSACLSFESRSSPGDFLRQRNSAIHVQPFDGSAQNRSDATFCPQRGKNGRGNALSSLGDPAKYIRHYYGKLYVASNGGRTAQDTAALWADDVSFIVAPPWSP